MTVNKYYRLILLGSFIQTHSKSCLEYLINQIFCRHLEIVFANPQPACFVVIGTIIQVNVVGTFYLLKHMWCFTAEEKWLPWNISSFKTLLGSLLFEETNVKSIVLALNCHSENAAVKRDCLGIVMRSA